MEYFGSRLIWTSIENIIDPENDEHLNEHNEADTDNHEDQSQPSTSREKTLPNEIEYD